MWPPPVDRISEGERADVQKCTDTRDGVGVACQRLASARRQTIPVGLTSAMAGPGGAGDVMTRYLNGWTALCAWVVLMGVVWVSFVPGAVSVSSFAVIAVTGPLLVVVLSMLWRSQQPEPSAGQRRAEVEEAETAARAKK